MDVSLRSFPSAPQETTWCPQPASVHLIRRGGVLGVDDVSDLNAPHSRKCDYHEVQLYAFNVLALGGDDLRSLPLSLRKTNPSNARCAGAPDVAALRREIRHRFSALRSMAPASEPAPVSTAAVLALAALHGFRPTAASFGGPGRSFR